MRSLKLGIAILSSVVLSCAQLPGSLPPVSLNFFVPSPPDNPWQHKIQYRQDYLSRDTFTEGSGFSVSYHFTIAEGTELDSLEGTRAVVEGHEDAEGVAHLR